MYNGHVSKDWNIKISWKRYCPCLWKHLKPILERILAIKFCVKVWTMRLFAVISVQTLLQFKVIWMKFLFLPTVTKRTSVLHATTIFIRSNKVFSMPILAHLHLIIKDRRLSSIVLPVMSIYANISLMIILTIRTPHSFKMKNIEVHIWLKFLNQFY